MPGLVIAEVSYLLARDAGSAVEAAFLRSFTTGFLTVVDLTATDLGRCAKLVEQYFDLPLRATDTSEPHGFAQPCPLASACGDCRTA